MKQILNLIKRKLNARRIRIEFPRAANFRIPEKIKLMGKKLNLLHYMIMDLKLLLLKSF